MAALGSTQLARTAPGGATANASAMTSNSHSTPLSDGRRSPRKSGGIAPNTSRMRAEYKETQEVFVYSYSTLRQSFGGLRYHVGSTSSSVALGKPARMNTMPVPHSRVGFTGIAGALSSYQ